MSYFRSSFKICPPALVKTQIRSFQRDRLARLKIVAGVNLTDRSDQLDVEDVRHVGVIGAIQIGGPIDGACISCPNRA